MSGDSLGRGLDLVVASTCVDRVAYDFAVEVADTGPSGFP